MIPWHNLYYCAANQPAGGGTARPRPCAMKPEHLKQLIDGKRQWSEPLRPEEQAEGFKGWYASKHLPHFDSRGAQQYLTEMRSTSGGLCAISRIIQSKRIWCRRSRIGHGAVRASGAKRAELGVPLRIRRQGVCWSGWGEGRWLLLSGDEPSPPLLPGLLSLMPRTGFLWSCAATQPVGRPGGACQSRWARRSCSRVGQFRARPCRLSQTA